MVVVVLVLVLVVLVLVLVVLVLVGGASGASQVTSHPRAAAGDAVS